MGMTWIGTAQDRKGWRAKEEAYNLQWLNIHISPETKDLKPSVRLGLSTTLTARLGWSQQDDAGRALRALTPRS